MRRKFAALALALLILCGCGAPVRKPHEKLYGAWVATTYNLDFPSEPGLSTAQLKREITSLLDGAQGLGLNAIFLQVRPCGDAIYPSKLYPWSHYLTGEQGRAPEGGFDPLAFWIEQAHQRGIALHAWINPFRVTQGGADMQMAENNLANTHPEWTVRYSDGNLYVNPGIPEARDYIVSGVQELLDHYELDGIHFDDYFYPGADFDDDAEYQGNIVPRADWRRQNVTDFVSAVSRVTRRAGVTFGISPFAIWRNRASDPAGSDTSGQETYDAHYADTRAWVKQGLVDYIAPQIYWQIGNRAADYETLLNWWCDTVRDTDVRLYIGHAGYRTEDAKPGDIWYGADEIRRQMAMNRDRPEVDGSIHFRLGVYLAHEELSQALKVEYVEGSAQ